MYNVASRWLCLKNTTKTLRCGSYVHSPLLRLSTFTKGRARGSRHAGDAILTIAFFSFIYHQTSLHQVISSRCHGHQNIMRPCDYTESLFWDGEGSGRISYHFTAQTFSFEKVTAIYDEVSCLCVWNSCRPHGGKNWR